MFHMITSEQTFVNGTFEKQKLFRIVFFLSCEKKKHYTSKLTDYGVNLEEWEKEITDSVAD